MKDGRSSPFPITEYHRAPRTLRITHTDEPDAVSFSCIINSGTIRKHLPRLDEHLDITRNVLVVALAVRVEITVEDTSAAPIFSERLSWERSCDIRISCATEEYQGISLDLEMVSDLTL